MTLGILLHVSEPKFPHFFNAGPSPCSMAGDGEMALYKAERVDGAEWIAAPSRLHAACVQQMDSAPRATRGRETVASRCHLCHSSPEVGTHRLSIWDQSSQQCPDLRAGRLDLNVLAAPCQGTTGPWRGLSLLPSLRTIPQLPGAQSRHGAP